MPCSNPDVNVGYICLTEANEDEPTPGDQTPCEGNNVTKMLY